MVANLIAEHWDPKKRGKKFEFVGPLLPSESSEAAAASAGDTSKLFEDIGGVEAGREIVYVSCLSHGGFWNMFYDFPNILGIS